MTLARRERIALRQIETYRLLRTRQGLSPECNFDAGRRDPNIRAPDNFFMSGFKPEHFINRELSWLEFNQRVLDEALDPANPLLERLKFFTIVSSNLDEFFEVRVAGLKQEMESGQGNRSVDGLTARETFQSIVSRVRRMVADQYDCWRDDLKPALVKHSIRILEMDDLIAADLGWLEEYYLTKIR